MKIAFSTILANINQKREKMLPTQINTRENTNKIMFVCVSHFDIRTIMRRS